MARVARLGAGAPSAPTATPSTTSPAPSARNATTTLSPSAMRIVDCFISPSILLGTLGRFPSPPAKGLGEQARLRPRERSLTVPTVRSSVFLDENAVSRAGTQRTPFIWRGSLRAKPIVHAPARNFV